MSAEKHECIWTTVKFDEVESPGLSNWTNRELLDEIRSIGVPLNRSTGFICEALRRLEKINSD